MYSTEKGLSKWLSFPKTSLAGNSYFDTNDPQLDSVTKVPVSYAHVFSETYSVLIIDAKYFVLYQDLGKLVNI